jgi:hypothetical protein
MLRMRSTRTMVIMLLILTLLCPFAYGQTDARLPPTS